MATTTTPPATRPRRPTASALNSSAYKGSQTTLCAGCGHNAISERIIEAFYEMGVEPHRVAKLSGIGCSTKSPAYFLGTARTASTPCTGACPPSPPAPCWPTGT